MAQISLSPNPAAPSSWITVTGTDFQRTATRILVDQRTVGLDSFKPNSNGNFTIGFQCSGSVTTQTVEAQQKKSGKWTTIAPSVTLTIQIAEPPPPPPPPPPGNNIKQATPATTVFTLQQWAEDNLVDGIHFNTGNYLYSTLYLKQSRTRPILWDTAPGVIFDCGGSSTGFIHIGTNDGPGTPQQVGMMTFDFAGSTIQNFVLGSFGIFMFGWTNGIVVKNPTIQKFTGSADLSHAFYVESDKIHHGTDITIENATVIGPGKGLFGSGVQIYAHDTLTGTNNVHVIGGKFSGLKRGFELYSDGVGFLADGVKFDNVSIPIEAPYLPPLNAISGTVKNTVATNSGASAWNKTLLKDGGGNAV